jgi:hypothetical protein
MSKLHSYRVQLHCDKQMHSDINDFAAQRGLSQSLAARVLIERALTMQNDQLCNRLDKLEGYLDAVLHAATASRILAADAAQCSGSKLSGDELRDRISKLIDRYKSF